MTARTIRESWDGGTIAVSTRYVGNVHDASAQVVLNTTERGMSSTRLHLTPAEAKELAVALNVAAYELTYDHASTQTASVGAGAAPTGETSDRDPLADDPDGNTRTQAAGPSVPPRAEPGRPITHDSAAYRAETAAMLARHQATRTAGIDAAHEAAKAEDAERADAAADAERCVHGYEPGDCPDFGCTHTHQSPWPKRQPCTPEEPGYEGPESLAPIVVDPPGENARAVAAVLNRARAELLANSTPVPAVPVPDCTHLESTHCTHTRSRFPIEDVVTAVPVMVCSDCFACVEETPTGFQTIGCGCFPCHRAASAVRS